MKHFHRLMTNIDGSWATSQLAAHPELWNQHPERTSIPGSPHAASSDIWLRFRDPTELHEPADYGAPHFAVWYPAWHLLPGLHPIVFDVARAVEATYIGGCLITRIPAGAAILPHVDRGWHPESLPAKAYIILKANDGCVNWCEDEAVVMKTGTAWRFRNDLVHSVQNNGDSERIAVILTMRTS